MFYMVIRTADNCRPIPTPEDDAEAELFQISIQIKRRFPAYNTASSGLTDRHRYPSLSGVMAVPAEHTLNFSCFLIY